jgi:hypothetical protein
MEKINVHFALSRQHKILRAEQAYRDQQLLNLRSVIAGTAS